jgi:uncharacterized membrane protein (DUF106 family)
MNILLIELVIAAIIYSLSTFFLQRKVSDIKRVNEIRKAISQEQKELSEMLKNNANKQAIDEKQKKMMSLVSETMKYQMKAMFIVIPLFLVVYYELLPMGFAGAGITYNIFSTNLNYQNIFIIIAFISGIVLLVTFTIYEKVKSRKASAAASAGNIV